MRALFFSTVNYRTPGIFSITNSDIGETSFSFVSARLAKVSPIGVAYDAFSARGHSLSPVLAFDPFLAIRRYRDPRIVLISTVLSSVASLDRRIVEL